MIYSGKSGTSVSSRRSVSKKYFFVKKWLIVCSAKTVQSDGEELLLSSPSSLPPRTARERRSSGPLQIKQTGTDQLPGSCRFALNMLQNVQRGSDDGDDEIGLWWGVCEPYMSRLVSRIKIVDFLEWKLVFHNGEYIFLLYNLVSFFALIEKKRKTISRVPEEPKRVDWFFPFFFFANNSGEFLAFIFFAIYFSLLFLKIIKSFFSLISHWSDWIWRDVIRLQSYTWPS